MLTTSIVAYPSEGLEWRHAEDVPAVAFDTLLEWLGLLMLLFDLELFEL